MLRDALVSQQKALKLTDLSTQLSHKLNRSCSSNELLRWLDVCTGTQSSETEPAFLKVRAHFFQRTTQGLWACFNPGCGAKKNTPLEAKWPFGYVYVTQRQICRCGSPVFELAFCQECNEPHLLARDKNHHLVQWEAFRGDEFALQSESSGDDDGQVFQTTAEAKDHVELARSPILISSEANTQTGYTLVGVNQLSGAFDSVSEHSIELGLCASDPACSHCDFSGYNQSSFYRRALLGSPFYVANAVPTVLEYCPDFQDEDSGKAPMGPQSLSGL